jgi:histone-lysine N-methyltransferase SETMAR
MVEFMHEGTTVTSEVYYEAPQKLHRAVQKKKTWNADIQYSDANSFLGTGQEKSADGGIYAKRDHRNIRSVLRNTPKTAYSVVILHDNARPHTAARSRALLEHFNWELLNDPAYSLDLAPSDYHLFTYVKNWLRSQRFNSNEFMEGVKTWLTLQAADFFDKGIQKLLPR